LYLFYSGSYACFLHGGYIDDFKNKMLQSCDELPVVVLEFVKIVNRRG
jgi:hypothetical protein